MELYCEQNVNNTSIDKHRKRNSILSVLRKVLLGIGIVLLFFLLGFGVNIGNGIVTIILGVAISLFAAAPFVLAFVFLGRYLKNVSSEYDYILNGGILRIVRVIQRSKRKLMATIRLDSIESIGKISSETYERFAASKNLKKQYAVCNYDDEEAIVYVRYRNEGEDYLLHMEPNEELVSSIRRSLPRISIMDKSMNNLNPVKKQ